MLAEPEDDGSPVLDHLLAIERQTGVRPQILVDAPPMPPGCDELWRIFNELHSCRGSTGFGPTRITFLELDAWERVTRTRLAGWEVRALVGADLAFLARWKPNKVSGAR